MKKIHHKDFLCSQYHNSANVSDELKLESGTEGNNYFKDYFPILFKINPKHGHCSGASKMSMMYF